jgi:holliday junction DNA helicase RuvB
MPDTPALSSAQDPLRPTRLSEFSGQPSVVEQLGVILSAAASREQLAPHLLFSGPPGLGKTTLSALVAGELGVPMVTTSGPALSLGGDLATLLTGLSGPTVVFIDEIHRLERKVEELLYAAMEDGVLDIRVGQGPDGRILRVPLVPFTLVGATTQRGLVSAPLRDRFGFTAQLRLYDDDALARIVICSAAKLGVTLDELSALRIARRSRGTPRVANQLLARVRDFAAATAAERIDGSVVDAALELFKIDPIGLDETGLALLRALCVQFAGGPVGLTTLAAAIDETPTTLTDVYEPFLLRRGLLARTPRGRVATDAAFAHLGLEVPARLPLPSPVPPVVEGQFDEPELF